MNDKEVKPFCPKTGEIFCFSFESEPGTITIEGASLEITPDGQESLVIGEEFVTTLSCVTSDKERCEQVNAVIDEYIKNKKK
jgi:hypothetical protein